MHSPSMCSKTWLSACTSFRMKACLSPSFLDPRLFSSFQSTVSGYPAAQEAAVGNSLRPTKPCMSGMPSAPLHYLSDLISYHSSPAVSSSHTPSLQFLKYTPTSGPLHELCPCLVHAYPRLSTCLTLLHF